MSHRVEDDDLRARFAAQRQEEARGRPPFAVTAPKRLRRGMKPVWVVVPAAAAVAALWLIGRDAATREPPYPIDLSVTFWEAPTDFLLVTPGSELLGNMPELGTLDPVADVESMNLEVDDTAS